MNKQILGGLGTALVAAVLVVLSVPVNAAEMRVNVPFSFQVGDATLPPGAYTVSTEQSTLSIRGANSGRFRDHQPRRAEGPHSRQAGVQPVRRRVHPHAGVDGRRLGPRTSEVPSGKAADGDEARGGSCQAGRHPDLLALGHPGAGAPVIRGRSSGTRSQLCWCGSILHTISTVHRQDTNSPSTGFPKDGVSQGNRHDSNESRKTRGLLGRSARRVRPHSTESMPPPSSLSSAGRLVAGAPSSRSTSRPSFAPGDVARHHPTSTTCGPSAIGTASTIGAAPSIAALATRKSWPSDRRSRSSNKASPVA